MGKKVSIIIPVYNGSNYLREAIESALAQTYKNLEIVVVNDGSTDDGATAEIAKSYGDKIKYYEKENGGAASALNYGIQKMTGDYLSWLSHDDLYYPNKVERQIEELEKYDDKTILFSNFDFIDPSGKKFDTVYLDHKMLMEKPDYAVLRGCIGGITLLIPKQALKDCGDFRLDLRCVQDYEMWFRMLEKYKFVHMEDVLTMTRIHPQQDTQTSPKMISEGNWLWAYLTENYPKKKMIEYEGCEYLFYKEMENYLENTPYTEAIEKVHNLASQCLEKQKSHKKEEITVVVLENGTKEDLEKTIESIKNQTYKNVKIIIEGKTKIDGCTNTKNREDTLKNISTNYFTMVHANVTMKENWLEEELQLVEVTKKGVIISDYPRPLKTGAVDNLCSFLLPIDGVILKYQKGLHYENDYQFLYDIASKDGSFVTGENYLENVEESYKMEAVFSYQRKVLEDGKALNHQMATLSYDIACIYNHFGKEGKKVSMYEPCDEYRELKFSRSFLLFKKYYDYKKRKKKRL